MRHICICWGVEFASLENLNTGSVVAPSKLSANLIDVGDEGTSVCDRGLADKTVTYWRASQSLRAMHLRYGGSAPQLCRVVGDVPMCDMSDAACTYAPFNFATYGIGRVP